MSCKVNVKTERSHYRDNAKTKQRQIHIYAHTSAVIARGNTSASRGFTRTCCVGSSQYYAYTLHTHIHTHTYARIHAYMHACMHTYIHYIHCIHDNYITSTNAIICLTETHIKHVLDASRAAMTKVAFTRRRGCATKTG